MYSKTLNIHSMYIECTMNTHLNIAKHDAESKKARKFWDIAFQEGSAISGLAISGLATSGLAISGSQV